MVLGICVGLCSRTWHNKDVHLVPIPALLHNKEVAHRVFCCHGIEYRRDHVWILCYHVHVLAGQGFLDSRDGTVP